MRGLIFIDIRMRMSQLALATMILHAKVISLCWALGMWPALRAFSLSWLGSLSNAPFCDLRRCDVRGWLNWPVPWLKLTAKSLKTS